MADPAVIIKNVSKSFKIPLESSSGLKQKLINFFKGRRGYRTFTPLDDISFTIEKGDFFGIVGRNGSGKSTLLKTIAEIYSPNGGRITVNGKLVPFIELGVGFNPELTGRENVFLNGALLGFSRSEMELMYDEIVDFAELHDFMEERLKNYSSGMQVRLAFSIAIRAQADVLLLDEVLAVGDESFQQKCYAYFAELRKKNKTVILVTHDMSAVQRFCNKAILIDGGKIVLEGKPLQVAEKYTELNLSARGSQVSEDNVITTGLGMADLYFAVKDRDGSNKTSFLPEELINVEIGIKAIDSDLLKPRVGLVINNEMGSCVFATNTQIENIEIDTIKKGSELKVTFSLENIFTDGVYNLSGAVASNEDESVYSRKQNVGGFAVAGWLMKDPIVHPAHKTTIHLN